MDRREVYIKIKDLNLEDLVKERFNRNFTQVSTSELLDLVNQFINEGDCHCQCACSEASSPGTTDWHSKYIEVVKTFAEAVSALPEQFLEDVITIAKSHAENSQVQNVNFSNEDILKMFNLQ